MLLNQQLERDPEDIEALCLSALTHWRGPGDLISADALLERARVLQPSHVKVLTLSAELHLHTGKIDSARVFAERAVAIDDRHSTAFVVLARADPRRVNDETLAQMKRLSAPGELEPRRLRYLHNAIGRVLDARGDFDAAFVHFDRSNRHARGAYEPGTREARLKQARSLFTRDYFHRRHSYGLEDAGCVFIVGMPRSGSTLLEQILAAHPETDTCRESDALGDIDRSLHRKMPSEQGAKDYFAHLRGIGEAQVAQAASTYLATTSRQMGGASPRRRIDKRLGNFLHVPLIRLMFPDGVALHVHRHPLDVCLSCFTQDFDGHAYANDLADLAHYYGIYQDYLRLWSDRLGEQVRHCRYETLVGSLEQEARRILGILALDWNGACAEPHRLSRFVSTASAAQVLEPVDTGRVARWRNYARHLEPLVEALGGLQGVERMDREFA